MIEIICKDNPERVMQDKGEETVFLPKNIRQVGSPRGRHRIYLEDYVYTYLRSIAKGSETCAAVFLGKSQVVKDIRYTFASGVVECGAAVFQWDKICLDESFWDYIYKEQKRYFPELEIVGWVLGKEGQSMELPPAVEAAHRKYFAGRDKILMLIDILEGEELFFIYEQGYLQKREGYYIYYEKNLAMQEYMIYKKEEEVRLAELKSSVAEDEDSEDGEEKVFEAGEGQAIGPSENEDEQIAEDSENTDSQTEEPEIKTDQWQDARPVPKEPKTQAEEALETYRKMLLERQGKQDTRQNRRFLYTASSFFLVVLCVIGITTINNYRKMQEVEDVLGVMSRGSGQAAGDKTGLEEEDVDSGEEDALVVETVESKIEPLAPDAEEQKDTEESVKATEQQDKSEEVADNGEKKSPDGDSESGKRDEPDKPENTRQGDSEKEADQEKQDGTDEESGGKSQGGAQEAAAGVGEKYYTVQAGDTLNSICLDIYKSKDMVQALKKLNGIEDGDKILVGQKLLLP